MPQDDFDLELGGPAGPGPAEGQATPDAPPAPADEPEFLELKVRDESWRAPKSLAQQFADELGWPLEELKTRLEVGYDGNRIYQGINAERDELSEYRRELEGLRDQMLSRTAPQDGNGRASPEDRRVPLSRPPGTDVTGTVLWLADQIERIAPLIERVPEIERGLSYTHQSIKDREEQRDLAEERVVAHNAYDDVADQWKKENLGELPPRRELEAILRRIPLSDDTDMSWHDIWDKVGWMVSGPSIARRQRRQAVLDSQHPEARITVPVSRAPLPPGSPSGPSPLTGNETMEELEKKIAGYEKELSGLTLGQIQGR